MAKDPFFVNAVITRMEMSGKGSGYVHRLLNKIRVGKTISHREIREAICRLWLIIEKKDEEDIDYKAKFIALQDAVREIYYEAGHWQLDRPAPKLENEYWEQLRDAAGFEPGHAPKPKVPYKDPGPSPYDLSRAPGFRELGR